MDFSQTCGTGNSSELITFIRSNPFMLTSEDPTRNWTPVHWAAFYGDVNCIHAIMQLQPTYLHLQASKSFCTPLHCAAEGNQSSCLNWLIHAGANPEAKDVCGETALHKAARIGSYECAKILIAASKDIHSLNFGGQSALSLAVAGNHLSIANYMNRGQPNPTKRSRDELEEQPEAKRTCALGTEVCPPTVLENKLVQREMYMQEITSLVPTGAKMRDVEMMATSALEHSKLLRQETGYNQAVLENLIASFHGC